MTRKGDPERPKRLQWLMDEARRLQIQEGADSLPVRKVQTSDAMLAELGLQLDSQVAASPATMASALAPSRSASVAYLKWNVVPSVTSVHTKEYLTKLASKVKRAKKEKGVELDSDTPVSPGSYSAALCAVLSSCQAVDAVCTNAHANAFAVVRPPAHHAGANGPTKGTERFAASQQQGQVAFSLDGAAPSGPLWFHCAPPCAPKCGRQCETRNATDVCGQGFCLLNNAAIAAKHALEQHRESVERVVIIDIDLHHGNGTEEIVRGWEQVMFVLLHGAGSHPDDPPLSKANPPTIYTREPRNMYKGRIV